MLLASLVPILMHYSIFFLSCQRCVGIFSLFSAIYIFCSFIYIFLLTILFSYVIMSLSAEVRLSNILEGNDLFEKDII